MARLKQIALLLFFLYTESLSTHPSPSEFIVWNVGQGSWATAITPEFCFHFDLGGEFAPFDLIAKLCQRRKNSVSYSHWDMDHIVFSTKAQAALPDLCILHHPGGRGSAKKMRMLAPLPDCSHLISTKITEVTNLKNITTNGGNHSANDQSRVFLWQGAILIPGDSTREAEQVWSRDLAVNNHITHLLLGHHGSNTSSWDPLLNRLSNLKLAVASSRRARYGHPHPKVIARLKQRKVPLLLTEEWGNIHFSAQR